MSMPRYLILALLLSTTLAAGDWSSAVEVRHDDEIAISYQARLDGTFLVVRAALGPGWHTFAMDNKRRADEKLAGKPALSVDRPTEIVLLGFDLAGSWYQTPPKDFSHPDLRWFSWGFEGQAVFAAKIRRPPSQRSTVRAAAAGHASRWPTPTSSTRDYAAKRHRADP